MDDVGSILEPTSSLAWTDVTHADIQKGYISLYTKH